MTTGRTYWSTNIAAKSYFHSVVIGVSLAVLLLILSMIQLAAQGTVDKDATRKTKALQDNLKRISAHGIMFGHQEDLAYGVGWNNGKEDTPNNIDFVAFDNIRQWIFDVYKRGGINTLSWHVDNTTTGGNAWDTVRTVKHILPGGKDHEKFKKTFCTFVP